MKPRVLPPAFAGKLKIALEKNFKAIAESLDKNELTITINLLFELHKIIQTLKPYIGQGKRLVTKKIIWDFSWYDASCLLNNELPALQKTYSIHLANSALLWEALQIAYHQAASEDDNDPQVKLKITALTIPNTMIKLFAYITNSDFFAINTDLNHAAKIAETLNIVSIYNRQHSWFGGINFFKPVEIMQEAYQNYSPALISRMSSIRSHPERSEGSPDGTAVHDGGPSLRSG